jgi:hypothetical protein
VLRTASANYARVPPNQRRIGYDVNVGLRNQHAGKGLSLKMVRTVDILESSAYAGNSGACRRWLVTRVMPLHRCLPHLPLWARLQDPARVIDKCGNSAITPLACAPPAAGLPVGRSVRRFRTPRLRLVGRVASGLGRHLRQRSVRQIDRAFLCPSDRAANPQNSRPTPQSFVHPGRGSPRDPLRGRSRWASCARSGRLAPS